MSNNKAQSVTVSDTWTFQDVYGEEFLKHIWDIKLEYFRKKGYSDKKSLELYIYDKKIRFLTLEILETIEISLKSKIFSLLKEKSFIE